MIEDICKVFNFIIHINIQKAEKSFVYPAQTGKRQELIFASVHLYAQRALLLDYCCQSQ